MPEKKELRPRAILLFERLFLGSLALGAVQAFGGWDALAARGSAGEMLALLALTFGTLGGLVLLVSRGRSRAAKWVLVLLYAVGLPLTLGSWDRGTLVGSAWLALVQAAMQVAALALLFTAPARAWLAQPDQ